MALPSPTVAVVAASPTWGLWARPADHPGQVALVLAVPLAVVAVVPKGPRWLAGSLDFSAIGDLPHPRRFVTIASFAAAFLSLVYIEFYLRGGPRAPQAPAFWIEGRALSHALLTWQPPDPGASFRATSLLFTWPDRVASIAPPGYPLLLAPAFLVGAPMLVGPLLAAGIVIVTWLLARELAGASVGRSPIDAEAAGRVAAGLSVVCVALRYATAECIPDGLVALALACALLTALRAKRAMQPRVFALPGLAVGVALVTAPASSVVASLAVVAVIAGSAELPRLRSAAWAAMGALPGLLLLLVAHHAAVGHGLVSPARVYRTLLVSHALPANAKSTVVAAARALRAHLADVANLEPLALLVAVPVLGARRSKATAVAGAVIVLEALVDLAWTGRGGDASMDRSTLRGVLPIEHALLGLAVVTALPRRVPATATLAMALSLGGFAFHTSHAHIAMAKADLGHPHFEPDVAREANVTHGLLFFDDDQGYELAANPGAAASHGVEAARMRNDDHDRLLYDLLGHPAAHRYLATAASASITVWSPPNTSGDAWRFEAEADWPPAQVTGGRVDIVEGAGMCPSDAKALSLDPTGSAEATMAIELPSPRGSTPGPARTWRIVPRVFLRGGPGEATMTLFDRLGGTPLAHWTWRDAANGPGCLEISEQTVTLGPETHASWLVVTAKGGAVALDKTVLRPR